MAFMTAPPLNFQERIRSALAESFNLSYWDLIPAAIHLRATIGQGQTEGSDYFRVDGGVSLLVYEIHGHVAMNQISQEKMVDSTGGTYQGTYAALGGVRNRELLKVLNCDVTLTNPDRESMEFLLTDVSNSSGASDFVFPLSSLFEEAGGGPLVFAEGTDIMPLIVNENDRIQMTASLRTVTAPWATNADFSTEYGVTLMGVLMRARETN